LKETGIFYGSSSGKTESVAVSIFSKLESRSAVLYDVADASLDEMMNYKNLILGIPTWGIGELQDDWLAAIPVLESLNLKEKNVALFGLGDQESYPDTFVDGLGKLFNSLGKTGCNFTGSWCTMGYNFEESEAVRGFDFVGLVLDVENQDDMTEMRINSWLSKLNFA
jgi:flavodoxin I